MPSSAVVASSVVWPLTCSTSRTSFMFRGLSSTIRIRLMLYSRVALSIRNGEVEGRSLARRALEPDAAAVQLDEAAREREAEARAFLPCSCSRCRPGGTPRTPPPGRPARCRCRCRVTATWTAPSSRVALTVDASAVRRELHRVRKQVEQDLLELALVGRDHVRAPARRRGRAAMPCLVARSRISVIASASAAGRSNCDGSRSMRPGLDLRQVEHVVDELEQVLAGRVDVLAGSRPASR